MKNAPAKKSQGLFLYAITAHENWEEYTQFFRKKMHILGASKKNLASSIYLFQCHSSHLQPSILSRFMVRFCKGTGDGTNQHGLTEMAR